MTCFFFVYVDLSQEEFRKFELAFQNAIFDWVSDFLKNPKVFLVFLSLFFFFQISFKK